MDFKVFGPLPVVGDSTIVATRTLRRALSPLLAVLLLGSGVVAPALERGGAQGPALEADHHASTCVRGHDHTICTQLGANRLAPTDAVKAPEPAPAVELSRSDLAGLEATRTPLSHLRARAPPAA